MDICRASPYKKIGAIRLELGIGECDARFVDDEKTRKKNDDSNPLAASLHGCVHCPGELGAVSFLGVGGD